MPVNQTASFTKRSVIASVFRLVATVRASGGADETELAEFLLWVDYRTDGISSALVCRRGSRAGVPCSRCGTSTCRSRRVAARMEPMTLLATLNFLAPAFCLLLAGAVLALSAPA